MDKVSLRALLDSTVHVLGSMNDDGSNMVIQNCKANYGTSATPFFSSAEILLQSVDASQNYLSMTARTLFDLLPDTHFVLNPRSVSRYVLAPELTKQLLDGSYFAAPVQAPQAAAKEEQSLGAKFRSILSLRKN